MARPGRNDLCSCGSGRKFKKCCERKTPARTQSRILIIAVGGALLAAAAAGVASFTANDSRSSTRVWDPVHQHYHDATGTRVP